MNTIQYRLIYQERKIDRGVCVCLHTPPFMQNNEGDYYAVYDKQVLATPI